MRTLGIVFGFLSLLVSGVMAQEFRVSGKIVDSESGENLVAAHIFEQKSKKVAITDVNGYFTINIPSRDLAILNISYVGYQTKSVKVYLPVNEVISIKMAKGNELPEIQIKANHRETDSDMVGLNPITLNSLPQVLGETDLMRAMQYFPGVLPSDETKNSLFVRGGSPDQNLILVDGVPALNLYHIGNSSSSFNPDIVNGVKLIKGGFSAQYGGRLSSILDVTMKNGNKDHLSGGIQLGMLAARANMNGPIGPGEKSSFIVSVRSFYSPFLALAKTPIRYGFQDYFMKIHQSIGTRSSFSGFAFITNDLFNSVFDRSGSKGITENSYNINWKNRIFSFKWNHRIRENQNLEARVYQSAYEYNSVIDGKQIDRQVSISNGNNAIIRGGDLKWDHYGNIHTSLGFQGKKYLLSTGNGYMNYYQTGSPRYDSIFNGYLQTPTELALFVNLEFNPNKRISGFLGGRASYYDFGKTQFILEPRIKLKYNINSSTYAGLSYTRMTQPLHLISQNYSELPGDIWIAANPSKPPEIADQLAFSWNYQPVLEHKFDIGVFYKMYQNLIYLNQNIPVFTGSWDEEEGRILKGGGQSYGLEFLYQYSGERVNGWLSSTWSRSWREFEGLNQSQPFPYMNDRPIYLSTSWIYNLNDHINLSAQWFLGSGKPITLPEQKFGLEDTNKVLFVYSEKNGYRMKPIHRLDIGINLSKKKKKGTRTWNIGIINVYNRKNPYYYTIFVSKNRQTEVYQLTARQWSFFPITPSVSYRFAFN